MVSTREYARPALSSLQCRHRKWHRARAADAHARRYADSGDCRVDSDVRRIDSVDDGGARLARGAQYGFALESGARDSSAAAAIRTRDVELPRQSAALDSV